MNSTISDDLDREKLALDAAENIKKLFESTQNIAELHKEVLEINLSISAYIEESKRRIEIVKLNTALHAKNSFDVVAILSNKSDEVQLEWFGRTIHTRKKVVGFLKYDMQCSSHYFTSIESKDRVVTRGEVNARTMTSSNEHGFASPLQQSGSPDIKPDTFRKRPGLRSCSKSPQWETSTKHSDEDRETKATARKKMKTHHTEEDSNVKNERGKDIPDSSHCRQPSDNSLEINNKGDGMAKVRRKCVPVTPPNKELGQGDCLPSTSDSMADLAHSHLNAQLPRKAVECNGYVEFTRTRNSRSADAMKWERKCKLQVSFSEDPLNVGEYIIWAIYYSDESKCRRNLMAAFNEVEEEERDNT